MRAFTFGIHFINTIHAVVEPVKQGTQSCITMESCYFNSATIYSYYLYSVLLLWLFQLLFQHIVDYIYYCCDNFDQSIQSCKQWSHNSFVIFIPSDIWTKMLFGGAAETHGIEVTFLRLHRIANHHYPSTAVILRYRKQDVWSFGLNAEQHILNADSMLNAQQHVRTFLRFQSIAISALPIAIHTSIGTGSCYSSNQRLKLVCKSISVFPLISIRTIIRFFCIKNMIRICFITILDCLYVTERLPSFGPLLGAVSSSQSWDLMSHDISTVFVR